MSRHVIIDGYNLLGVRGQVGFESTSDGERLRDALLYDLALYHQRKGYALTVVFDAWRVRGQLEHREHRAGVHVVYTRGGEKADQVIQRLVRQYGRDCVVVSSDLEIQHSARDHGAFVLTSKEFQGRLKTGDNQRVKRGGSLKGSPEILHGKSEEETTIPRPGKKGNPRKLPKAQRRRNRQVKGF